MYQGSQRISYWILVILFGKIKKDYQSVKVLLENVNADIIYLALNYYLLHSLSRGFA